MYSAAQCARRTLAASTAELIELGLIAINPILSYGYITGKHFEHLL